jgi:hypothetical protein
VWVHAHDLTALCVRQPWTTRALAREDLIVALAANPARERSQAEPRPCSCPSPSCARSSLHRPGPAPSRCLRAGGRLAGSRSRRGGAGPGLGGVRADERRARPADAAQRAAGGGAAPADDGSCRARGLGDAPARRVSQRNGPTSALTHSRLLALLLRTGAPAICVFLCAIGPAPLTSAVHPRTQLVLTTAASVAMLLLPSAIVMQRAIGLLLAVLGIPMWMFLLSLQGRLSRFFLRAYD